MDIRKTRFSALEIIVITFSIISLFTLAIFIGFEPILITGAIILILIDSIYLTCYLIKTKEKQHNKNIYN